MLGRAEQPLRRARAWWPPGPGTLHAYLWGGLGAWRGELPLNPKPVQPVPVGSCAQGSKAVSLCMLSRGGQLLATVWSAALMTALLWPAAHSAAKRQLAFNNTARTPK